MVPEIVYTLTSIAAADFVTQGRSSFPISAVVDLIVDEYTSVTYYVEPSLCDCVLSVYGRHVTRAYILHNIHSQVTVGDHITN